MASISKLTNGKWRARYRDETGKEHARHFDKKTEGQRWLDEVVAAQVAGNYVDPRAGNITFKDYAEQWRSLQTHGPNTARRVATTLTVHCYPGLGHLPMNKIKEAHLKGWLKGLPLADSTANIQLGTLKAIFKAAVDERVIATSPADKIKLPSRGSSQDMWIPTWAQVQAIRQALPPDYRAVIDLVIGAGLRQGELLGLEVDAIEFLKGPSIVVRQQRMDSAPNPLHIALPKSRESRRTIPIATPTAEALAEHIRKYAQEIEAPDWTKPKHVVRPMRLLFPHKTLHGHFRLMRQGEWSEIWREAARDAGWPPGNRAGVHSLRHFYASALIRHGESVTTVCRRLGHGDPNITLSTYAHLWPDSEATTRRAVEAMFAERDNDEGTSGLVVAK